MLVEFIFFLRFRRPPSSTLFPYTTLFRSSRRERGLHGARLHRQASRARLGLRWSDRKSTRLNSSHITISYAVFCLKKKHKRTSHAHPYFDKHHLHPHSVNDSDLHFSPRTA